MTDAEKEAIRARMADLGANADWATATALQFGDLCTRGSLNLQTLLLFALVVASGCRDGLPPAVAREIEELQAQVDNETSEQLAKGRN